MATGEPICPRCGEVMVSGWTHMDCKDRSQPSVADVWRCVQTRQELERERDALAAELKAARHAIGRLAGDDFAAIIGAQNVPPNTGDIWLSLARWAKDQLLPPIGAEKGIGDDAP